MIVKACHFLSITPYCHFPAIMLLTRNLLFLFFHTSLVLVLHSFTTSSSSIASSFVAPLTSPSFLLLLLSQLPLASCFSVTTSVKTPSSSYLALGPYLGKIRIELYFIVPRPNTTHHLYLVAIIHALKMWRHFLMGKKFELRTSHDGLKYLFEQPNLNARQRRNFRNIILSYLFKKE